MSDTIDDFKATAEAYKDIRAENLKKFMRTLHRLGVPHTILMPHHIRLHGILVGPKCCYDVWPTTDKFRQYTQAAPWENGNIRTQYGASKAFLACGYTKAQVELAERDVALDPQVYLIARQRLLNANDASAIDTIREVAGQLNCKNPESEEYIFDISCHVTAWKYFFGPYDDPRVEWDTLKHNVFVTYNPSHVLIDSYSIWNTHPESLEYRLQCLQVMAHIAEDKECYEKVFD